MIQRPEVYVRGITKEGEYGLIDALDLDERSFWLFVLSKLLEAGIVAGISEQGSEKFEELYERKESEK